MKYTIEVTQEDIDLGEPGSFCRCPIARAATRAFGFPVEVGSVMYKGRGGKLASMPSEAFIFMAAYDRLEPTEPFTFEVDTQL